VTTVPAATAKTATPERVERAQAPEAAPLLERAVPGALCAVASATLAAGTAAVVVNGVDAFRYLFLGLLLVTAGAHLAWMRYQENRWDRTTIGLLAGVVVAAIILAEPVVPEYSFGREVNGIIHRSLLTSMFLIGLGMTALCSSLYHLLGATPTAYDRSRYPLLLYPIIFALLVYAAVLLHVVREGAPNLGWDIVSTAYNIELVDTTFVTTPGLRNQILGTMLLIAMTSVIALPIGVGTGVFLAEYEGWLSRIIEFATLMLRAISVFILGVTAFTLVEFGERYPVGSPLSDIFRGYYFDAGGFKSSASGSFITASIVLSLLVIPIIAKSTEEGLRSVPRDIREGSIALGATEGHGFLHILLPWALPSILTGLLLGCAEAAGSVAVIMFIAGTGEFGVGPFREVTSLAFVIFETDRGSKAFIEVMGVYQFTAALLLLMITFGLSIAALVMKQRFGTRYQGGTTNQ
jgi:phosphate transport system permease protein